MPSNQLKPCACTGVRWCTRCRGNEVRMRFRMDDPVPLPDFLTDRPLTQEAVHDLPIHFFDPSTQSAPSCPAFRGMRLYRDFLSESEAARLLETLETTPFIPAQSGKAKQHYGPKINFNKRKINASAFQGIPAYARELESRARATLRDDPNLSAQERAALEVALLSYQATDVFVLRYHPQESSNLDFHLDDPFAYGELIFDLSLESDAVLTFVRGRPNSELEEAETTIAQPICIRVPLPARSLAVLYGPARFEWEHAVLAYDIESQRTSVTLRTLSQTLKETEAGRSVCERARQNVA